MRFNIPLSQEKADRIIASLDVSPNAQVLDVGCGVGEFLLQLIEKSNARGAGVDIDARLIASAKENASLRIGKSGAEFYTADVNTYSFSDHQFDLVICLGSTHAFGLGELAYPNALQRLQRLVKPGGCLLIGEGYWKQSPDPDYLALLGEPVGIYHDFLRETLKLPSRSGLSRYSR